MEKLTITTQKEAGISDEAVYALFQQAFSQWTDNGIDEPFLHLTLEDFKKVIHDAIVIVATDTDTGELLATHTFQKKRKQNYVHGCFLSVSPRVKHTSIATKMLKFETEFFREAGYEYLRGFTAVSAVWSVKWHKKNGYRVIGYFRPYGSNQYNYIFRKQLKPSLIWSVPLAPVTAWFHFIKSYTVTRLCKNSTGQLNLLGKVARKIYRALRPRKVTSN